VVTHFNDFFIHDDISCEVGDSVRVRSTCQLRKSKFSFFQEVLTEDGERIAKVNMKEEGNRGKQMMLRRRRRRYFHCPHLRTGKNHLFVHRRRKQEAQTTPRLGDVTSLMSVNV